ncbi:hypothetical protein FRC00_008988 [Tulasnella sp. 408]|nr:hypothetical protein FRC00_008988 [Tulasnella sp. 408]
MTLNRGEKPRGARHLAEAITCIPTGIQKQITEEEVYSQLAVPPATVIHDEHLGRPWLIAEGNNASRIETRLKSTPLEGFTTRAVQRSGGEWQRRERNVEEEIESRKPQESTSSRQPSERNHPAVPQPPRSRSLPSETNSAESLGALEGTSGPLSSSTPTASTNAGTATTSTVLEKYGSSGSPFRSPKGGPATSQEATYKRTCVMVITPTRANEAVVVAPTRRKEALPFQDASGRTDRGGPGDSERTRGDALYLGLVIYPALPKQFTPRAISLSRSHPLSIRYLPEPAQSKGWQKFGVFIQLDVTVNPMSLATLTQALETPAPILHSLRVSTTYTEQVDDSQPISPFILLDGKQGYLRRLELNKTPCAFDPTLLTSIHLMEGVCMRYQDVLDFLASSSQLEELHLADLKFTDGPPRELEQPLVLPQLKQLTLADGVERVGIIKLCHSIPADNCERLNLKRFVPVVEQILETEAQTTLRFGRHKTPARRSGKEQAPFTVSVWGGAPRIKLNVEDTMKVVAVVDGHFRCLQEFIAPGLRNGSPALRWITLQTIPSEKVVMKPEPGPAVRGRLEDFIDAVSHAYYGVAPGKQVPAEKRNSMTVVLDGTFGVNASTMKALVGGGEGALPSEQDSMLPLAQIQHSLFAAIAELSRFVMFAELGILLGLRESTEFETLSRTSKDEQKR